MSTTPATAPAGQRYAALNLDAETFRENGHRLIDDIAAFLELLPAHHVTRGEKPKEIRQLLGKSPLPENGMPLQDILFHAKELLFEHSLHNGSPRFWGYITSSAAPAGMLAELLASSVNPNAGANILSPVATEIEKQTIEWIAEFIGYTTGCGGLFVSGGNMANFTAFLAARKAKADWDIRQLGFQNKKMLIYCTRGTHTWVHKAADLFGFGLNSIRWIDMNEQQQMNVTALEQQIITDKQNGHLPFIIIGTAGSVSTGVIDPLDKIAEVSKKYNCWFHVDGAYGAPAAAVPGISSLFKGMEQADSVALDPHKWLYAPIEAGCTLVKNPQHLQDAFCFHPPYYNFSGADDDPATNFHEYGLQNTRGFRALKVWVQLQQVGRSGYVKMIGDDIKLAETLYQRIKEEEELQAISHHLSIVNFRYIPPEFKNCLGADEYLNKLNEEILNRLQAEGEVFISNAVNGNQYCLRACIVNFRTTEKDIKTLIEVVLRTGKRVHAEQKG
jgi:aromatic-L-amino-acid decarboxylase